MRASIIEKRGQNLVRLTACSSDTPTNIFNHEGLWLCMSLQDVLSRRRGTRRPISCCCMLHESCDELLLGRREVFDTPSGPRPASASVFR